MLSGRMGWRREGQEQKELLERSPPPLWMEAGSRKSWGQHMLAMDQQAARPEMLFFFLSLYKVYTFSDGMSHHGL